MPVSLDTLQTLEVFSDLEEQDLAQVAHIVIEKDVPAGQSLFVEAMKGETLFVLLEGAVQVTRKSSSGEAVDLYSAEEGEFLGAISLFEPGDRLASALTTKPSKILIVRRKDLLKLAEKFPGAAFHFSLGLARYAFQRLRESASLHQGDVDQGANLKNGS